MKEFSQEWSRISLDPLIQNIDAVTLIVRLTFLLIAVIPNPPERLTSLFVQDLICTQNDEVMHPDLRGAPIVVHFSYVKFGAEYLI